MVERRVKITHSDLAASRFCFCAKCEQLLEPDLAPVVPVKAEATAEETKETKEGKRRAPAKRGPAKAAKTPVPPAKQLVWMCRVCNTYEPIENPGSFSIYMP